MFLVDTNVVIDLLNTDSAWRGWSVDSVSDAAEDGEIAINPIIYGELAPPFDAASALDTALEELRLARLPLPYEAAFVAGQAFRLQRERGGRRSAPMADFYIGAHAEVARLTVITRDPRPFRSYFPSVRLLTPHSA